MGQIKTVEHSLGKIGRAARAAFGKCGRQDCRAGLAEGGPLCLGCSTLFEIAQEVARVLDCGGAATYGEGGAPQLGASDASGAVRSD